jgi:translation initiation factor 3 subunit G
LSLIVYRAFSDGGDAAGGKAGYVPPSMRAGASGGASMGDSMNRRREENSVRVSNLSEAG